jgi:16S rRNA (guanine527-N7)-methyltransferase
VYFQLLGKWNRKINLTGFDLDAVSGEALDRLFVEPLVASRYVPSAAKEAMDVGSGGGSPAIPLCVANPALNILLVEPKARKSAFLAEVIRALDLTNATVVVSRFEGLLARPDLHERHDILTIRAVRTDAKTMMGLQSFLKPGGLLFLFGGSSPANLVGSPFALKGTHPLVESLGSRLVVLEKASGA